MLSTAQTYVYSTDCDFQLYINSPSFFSRPVDDAAVGSTVRENKFLQSQTEVSDFQSLTSHWCSTSVIWVLFCEVVAALITHVNHWWTEVVTGPNNCGTSGDNERNVAGQYDWVFPQNNHHSWGMLGRHREKYEVNGGTWRSGRRFFSLWDLFTVN